VGSIATLEAPQSLPAVLIRPHVGPGPQPGGEFHPLGELGPARHAGRTFYITLRGFGRGAATRGNRYYRAFELDSTPYKRYGIPGADFTGGFYPVTIDVHFATGDSVCSQGTRLEKAHAKEPPVYAGGSGTFFGTIFGHRREYN
jgi:hypothetical protein